MSASPNHVCGSAPSGIMDPPAVVMPDAQVFARRALRLRELVGTVEALEDFLDFMARVVQAQHQLLEREPVWRPAPAAFDLALEHGLPPLGIDALRRDLNWQPELAALLDALELHVGQRQRPLLAALRQQSAAGLRGLADAVLDGHPGAPATRALMPLVAATLQVVWVRLAISLSIAPRRPGAQSRTLCPCCGSAPVVSMIHNEQYRSGVRYLHCRLCATEWHLERVTCSICGHGGSLLYQGLYDARGKPFLPVQAETCGDCHGYLKVVLGEQDGRAEPVADDLASLPLDLLLAEQGKFGRSGYNPLLVAGE